MAYDAAAQRQDVDRQKAFAQLLAHADQDDHGEQRGHAAAQAEEVDEAAAK